MSIEVFYLTVWALGWALLISLVVGAAKFVRQRRTRRLGIVMLAVAALVVAMNAMIWTV